MIARSTLQGISAFRPVDRPPRHVPSLEAYSLGCLALYIRELVEYGDGILPLLPSQAKLALLSAARKRKELDDLALGLLADPSHTIIDLRGTFPSVSENSVLRAISDMPNVRFVDLRSLPLTPHSLRTLAKNCPRIEVLRLGGWDSGCSCASESAVLDLGDALKSVLPRLDKDRGAGAETWDLLPDCGEGRGGGAGLTGGGDRLMELRALTWPEIPDAVSWHCERASPVVLINPTSEDVASRGLPPVWSPDVALDGAALREVAGAASWDDEREETPSSHAQEDRIVHIAERFRMAYVSRAKRLHAAAERQRRRQERQSSAAELAIRKWELEL